MPEPRHDGGVYRYRADDGHWVYVSSLSLVPEGKREGAEALRTQPGTQDAARGLELDELGDRATELKDRAEGALKKLPGQAKSVTKKGRVKAEALQREVGDVVPFVKELDLPSVAVGFASALVLWLVALLVRGRGRLLIKVGMVAAIFALVVGAYFGWLRRSAGLSAGQLSSPAAVVKDAKDAARQMQDRLQKNERILKKLEETSR